MANISVNFVKIPDNHDGGDQDNQKLLMQSMDVPALCGLAVRRLLNVVGDALSWHVEYNFE